MSANNSVLLLAFGHRSRNNLSSAKFSQNHILSNPLNSIEPVAEHLQSMNCIVPEDSNVIYTILAMQGICCA